MYIYNDLLPPFSVLVEEFKVDAYGIIIRMEFCERRRGLSRLQGNNRQFGSEDETIGMFKLIPSLQIWDFSGIAN